MFVDAVSLQQPARLEQVLLVDVQHAELFAHAQEKQVQWQLPDVQHVDHPELLELFAVEHNRRARAGCCRGSARKPASWPAR